MSFGSGATIGAAAGSFIPGIGTAVGGGIGGVLGWLFRNKDKKKDTQAHFDPKDALAAEYARMGPMWQGFMDQYGGMSREHLANATPLFGEAAGNFRNLYSSAGNSSARGGFQNIADTGGFDPATLSFLNSGYRGLTQPLSGEVTSRMRGKGVFDEDLATGGYKQGDIDLAIREAQASVPSIYSGLKRGVESRRRISGGYGPGFDESIKELSRESARETGKATREARLSVADRVRSGRMEMGSNLSQAEQSLQNLLFSRSNAGLGGLTNIQSTLSGNKLNALSGLSNIDQNEFSNKLNATQGLSNLYGTEMDAGLRSAAMQMQAAGASSDTVARLISIAQSQPGWWEKYGNSILNGLISAGSAYMNRPKNTTTKPTSPAPIFP